VRDREPPKPAPSDIEERGGSPSRRVVWVYLVVVGIAATAVSYLLFDQMVIQWFLDHPSTWHTNAWVDGFRQLGKAGVPIWLLTVWSCMTNRWRSTIVTVAAMILVGASVCPLKAIVRRSRPDMLPEASQQLPPQDQTIPWQKRVSFPSGDAAVVFAAATTLSLSLRRRWILPLFAAAGAIGVLRITVLAHYPSDVLAGAMIGVLCGVCAVRWVTPRWPLDQVRVPGRWRLLAWLLLVVVLPIICPYIAMREFRIFLKAYFIPLTVVVLVCLAVARRRA
jgi:undecaprenyl-diphosphatase